MLAMYQIARRDVSSGVISILIKSCVLHTMHQTSELTQAHDISRFFLPDPVIGIMR
jgi:hypothetical protein